MMTLTIDDVRKQGRNSVSKISLQLFDFSISQYIAVTFQTTGGCPKKSIFREKVHFFGKGVQNHGFLGQSTPFPKRVQIMLWENMYTFPEEDTNNDSGKRVHSSQKHVHI